LLAKAFLKTSEGPTVQPFIKQHEDHPGPPKRWKDFGDPFIWKVLHPEAPDSYLANTKADPDWEWTRAPEIREP